jgi:hypothetical protein
VLYMALLSSWEVRPKVRIKIAIRFWTLISPMSVVILAWSIGLAGYFLGRYFRYELPYLRFLSAAVPEISTGYAFVWLLTSLLAFFVGTIIAKKRHRRVPIVVSDTWSEDRAFRALVVAFLFISTVATLWVGVTVAKFGIGALIALTNEQHMVARSIILDAAFPGGRIVSGGFIAISVFSATLMAAPRDRPLGWKRKLQLGAMFFVGMAYLALIPILISGRINFFAAVIGSYIGVCIVKRRLYGFKYLPIAALLMTVVWGAKEYFTLKHVTTVSAWDQAYQGALFYYFNDVSNGLNIIGNLNGYYSWGWESARFGYFFTLTDDFGLARALRNSEYTGDIKTAGEYPLMMGPYVDFGFMGLVWLGIIGFACQSAYIKAYLDTRYAALYGLVFAALAMCVHASYITNHDIVFNCIVVAILARFSRQA